MAMFSTLRVLGVCSLSVMLAGTASGDIIPIGNGSNQQGRINDSFSKPGGISEGRTIRAGTTGGNAVFRGFMIFDTSSFVGSVGTGTLTYEVSTASSGSPGPYTVYGVSVDAGFDGAIDSAGERQALYQAAGGPNATLISNEAFSTGVKVLDVASFVQAERTGGNDVVAFLFVEDAPTLDGQADLLQIIDGNDPGQSPELELVVPEPSSLALIGLGALACVRRRR